MTPAPRARGWQALALVVLGLLAHLLLLANPGYFSHDEWQRADTVQSRGLPAYALEYGALRAGPEFGFPVRPLGFLQQGLSGWLMARGPLLPHLLDVAIHIGAALLFWRLLLQLGLASRRALAAAAIFTISPLATMATGWVGASFDRWYLLFGLVAALGFLPAARGDPRLRNLLFVLLGSAGAILSKETAVMLPAALLLGFALLERRAVWAWRPLLLATGLASLPIAAYLAVRWPAIVATLTSSVPGPYSPSLANVPGNAWTYLLQPFLPGAVELVSASLLPSWQWLVAALAQAAMLVLIGRRAGWMGVFAYLAGYFVFLLPLLPLPSQGAHYLYGSGLAFALGLAIILFPATPAQPTHDPRSLRDAGWRTFVALVLALVFMRSLVIQNALYLDGRCQAELLASFDPQATVAMARGAEGLHIQGVPGSRDWVAVRAFFGRQRYSTGGATPTSVGGAARPGDARFLMGTDCRVVLQ